MLMLSIDEDFQTLAYLMHSTILGLDFNHYTVLVPQDAEGFTNYQEDDHSLFCWTCGVSDVRKLERSLCAGCLKAMYCTLGCQEEDWEEHKDWCLDRMAKRAEKESMMMKEQAMKDIEADNAVD